MTSPQTGKRRSLSVTLAQLSRMRPFSGSSNSGGAAQPSENNAMLTRVRSETSRRLSLEERSRGDVPTNSAGDQTPSEGVSFRVGVAEDKNRRCRRTMEDTHSYVYDFMHQADNGYFAIFDGHAGRQAAEYCGSRFHIILAEIVQRNPERPIPDLLDATFTYVDAAMEKMHFRNQGCTAAVALVRWEQRPRANSMDSQVNTPHPNANRASVGSINQIASRAGDLVAPDIDAFKPDDQKPKSPQQAPPRSSVDETASLSQTISGSALSVTSESTTTSPSTERRRVLYTANAGDARVVLCRSGNALRLSYDHKGSDQSECQRVQQAGGTILNNRVNGVLAVTRALGDAYMKGLVTGHPYTTETILLPTEDEFIILACDGLWDVCTDQTAVDLIRNEKNEARASKVLVDYALKEYSTDNLTVMVVRLDGGPDMQRRSDSISTGKMTGVSEEDESAVID